MPFKTVIKNCNCVHCKQKLEQVNRSTVYWSKILANQLKDWFLGVIILLLAVLRNFKVKKRKLKHIKMNFLY